MIVVKEVLNKIIYSSWEKGPLVKAVWLSIAGAKPSSLAFFLVGFQKKRKDSSPSFRRRG